MIMQFAELVFFEACQCSKCFQSPPPLIWKVHSKTKGKAPRTHPSERYLVARDWLRFAQKRSQAQNKHCFIAVKVEKRSKFNLIHCYATFRPCYNTTQLFMSYQHFLDVRITVKLGYDELCGTVEICLLYPWHCYRCEHLFSKTFMWNQKSVYQLFVIAVI